MEKMGFVDGERDRASGRADSLAELDRLLAINDERSKEVKRLTLELENVSRLFNEVNHELIPNLLRQNGLSRIRLKDGREVSIKEDVSVSWVGDDEIQQLRSQEKFFEFLQNRGEADIVKLNVAFKRMPDETRDMLLEFLEEKELEYEMRTKVESSTLRKYFRELYGVGLDEDELQRAAESGKVMSDTDPTLQSMVKTFKYYATKVTEKKL